MLAALSNYSLVEWTIASCALTLITLKLFYSFKSKTQAKLAYEWGGRILVGEEREQLPNEIALALEESGSPYISSSEIVIWNAGHQPIHGSDIDGADPLRIFMPAGSRILRIIPRRTTNETISFSVTPDPEHPNVAFCSFDRMGPGEGVRFQILVTGVNYALSLGGRVRGLSDEIINGGRTSLGDATSNPAPRMAEYWPYINVLAGVLMVLMIPVGLLIKRARHQLDADYQLFSAKEWIHAINFVLLGWTNIAMGRAQLRARFGRYPRSLADH